MVLKLNPLILVADDNEPYTEMMSQQLSLWGYRTAVVFNRDALHARCRGDRPALVLLDLEFGEHNGIEVMRELLAYAPELAVVVITGNGSIDTAVSAVQQGACDFLTKPTDMRRLKVTLEKALERQRLSRKVELMEKIINSQDDGRHIFGNSQALDRLREMITSVAPTNATVLIQGESGTGKELVARALHDRSGRKGPFVPVNMAALPRELVESTLFGHEKGAFTGAAQVRVGCCEEADGGTLFLDEIGEMDPEIQAKLLRFLQEREVQRVGSNRRKSIDVRVVAATNRDLAERVKSGRFREDLYYRLQVVPIEVPPLRERRTDVPLLAVRFLERAAIRHHKDVIGFTPESLDILAAYDWPGNIRQLENMVERLVILSRTPEIAVADLPPEIRHSNRSTTPNSSSSVPGQDIVPFNQIEERAILDALRKAGGNVRETAKRLGLGQATLYRKIRQYGVRPRDFSPPATATGGAAASL